MTAEVDYAQPLKRKVVDSQAKSISPDRKVFSRIQKKKKPNNETQPPKPDDTVQQLFSKTSAENFRALGVDTWLEGSLNAMAITQPTMIQSMCIPQILKGKDCIGGSRTGSGKTIAFTVPILQHWARDPFGIFALILTPTRYIQDISLSKLVVLINFQGAGSANL